MRSVQRSWNGNRMLDGRRHAWCWGRGILRFGMTGPFRRRATVAGVVMSSEPFDMPGDGSDWTDDYESAGDERKRQSCAGTRHRQ